MAEINWKSKYNELKSKYMSAVDTAFRLGMEQGMQQAQVQQAQDQAAQQQAAEQAAAQGGQPGQPGQEGQPGESGQESGQSVQNPDSAHPQGSELDQHISTLEGMLGKAELAPEDLQAMKKSIESLKFGIQMKKSDLAVKSIAKSLAPKSYMPMSKTASANLSSKDKAALNLQQQIVANVMAGLEEESSAMSKSIADIVAGEGLKKD